MPIPGDEDKRSAEDYTLFVTNLPIELNEDGIEKLFKRYGKIKGIIARNEGRFAFISYGTYAEAENAISSLDGQPPLDLKVQFRKKSVDTSRDKGERNSVNFHALNTTVSPQCEVSPQISTQKTDYHQKDVQVLDSPIPRVDSLRSKISHRSHDTISSGIQSELTYSPYNEIEYAETNALWSRGCMTVDAAGRRHVTMGRGHTFYHIPEPHPKIIEDIGKVYEKRHARYYEYGSDKCKQYMGKCMHCSQHATLCCSYCDGFYCSRDCQIADWSKHQALCKNIPPLVSANCSREFFKEKNSNASESPVTPPQPEVEEKQQRGLRRPKDIVIDAGENIKNILTVNGETESNEQKSAVNSAQSTIRDPGRLKPIHDDDFGFKRADKIKEDSAAKKEHPIGEPIITHNNNNINEINSPLSILNLMTLETTVVAEICNKIDENTARVVLNFENVREMYESLVFPLASDCEEIASNYPNYVPNIHEFICMKKPGDDFWFRGCVLKIANGSNSIDTIEIASLDEGIVINQFEKIIPLINKYNEVCIFSATMKKENSESKIVFEPGTVAELKITSIDNSDAKNSVNHVKAILTSESGTSEVRLYQWTPWRSDKPVEDIQKEVQSSAIEKTLSTNKKKSIDRCELKDKTKVVIQSYRSPSVVFLRSFEADEIERHNRLVQNVAKSALTSPCLESLPGIGDYVLAKYVDDNFYRAMVLAVENEENKIVYIDYGNMEVTTLDKLRAMPESLMNEPCCTRKVILKGIKSVPPTKEAVDYLAILVAKEEQLICEFDGQLDKGGTVTLKATSGSSVNEEINKLLTPTWERKNEANNSDIREEETITVNSATKILSLGDIEIGNFGNIGDTISALFLETLQAGSKYVFALVDEEMIVHITTVMPEMMKKYCESTDFYIPRDNELCIALYEDNNWYRGCCFQSRASPNTSIIYFLDFGNIATVKHENIRIMTTDFLKPGTFGCVCTVNNFSQPSANVVSPQILSRLENLLIPNETYNVEIIGFDEEEYTIKLPEIHTKLVEEGLLAS